MKHWKPTLLESGKPRYIEIAEAIKRDIDAGVLGPGDRLPPQRGLARDVGLDFTTVSRGYSEAAKLGYIETFVGRGTFVREAQKAVEKADPRRALEEDPKMNMPPEPDDPTLIARMEQGLTNVAANLVPLLRYQSVTGSVQDREMAARWMNANGLDVAVDRLVITPGAHASLMAILTLLTKPGQIVLCEALTYPGIRAITNQLGLRLVGVQTDEDGIVPQALDAAIRQHEPAAVYLNPTLQNPLTHTVPLDRRTQIADLLKRHQTPLVEDDSCCFVSSQALPPISHFAPNLGWHVAGLSKCLGAGLRLALTIVPAESAKAGFSNILRTSNVMASPINMALMSRWIEDGTAAAIQTFVRNEAARRQKLAAGILCDCDISGQKQAFNIWLKLPEGTSRAEVMGHMATRQIGIMPSDAFVVSGPAPEALRVCLGGPISSDQLRDDLEALSYAATQKGWLG